MNQIGIPESERPELLAYLKKTYRYEDGGIVNRRTGRIVRGGKMNNGYLKMTIAYKGGFYSTPFQRVVWALCYDQLPTQTIDHINGDVHQNELCNLHECSRTQNCQNRHDRKGCFFHNVKKNGNNTYTAYKVTNGKYTKIATCNTDIEAYDKFVKYARIHQIGINPNTLSWRTYDAVKNQIPHITTGGIYG